MRCLTVLFIVPVVLSLLAGMAAAHDATNIISRPPWVVHVDVEKNLLFVLTDTAVYAQRMDSGKRLWSLPFETHDDCTFSRDTLVIEKTKGFQVIDKNTGKEQWKVSEDSKGKPSQTKFIGNSAWVYTCFDDGGVVYTPEGLPLQPTISGERTGKFGVGGWMPDTKTLLIVTGESPPNSQKTLTTWFWQPESGLIEKGYVLSSKDHPLLYYVTPGGKAVFDELNINNWRTRLTLIDARTGVVERVLETSAARYHFTPEGYMLTGSVEGDRMTAVNLDMDEAAVILAGEGHAFVLYSPVLAEGKDWIYSWDRSRRCWLWPLEEGATPRMIWQCPPGNYAPGEIKAIRPPHILFDTRRNKMEACRLEDMECVKTWHAEGPPRRHFMSYVSADLNRALAWYTREDAESREQATVTQVFEAHLAEPIREVPGSPRGLSPDGRHCVVQYPSNGPFHLVEIESGRTCASIPAEKEMPYNEVFFPPNSRYVAVHAPDQLTVIHLENEYTQVDIDVPVKYESFPRQTMFHSISFSPDGTYFVFQGLDGYVKLYSSSTGEVVRTFTEPDMVAARQESPPDGFLEAAASFGKRLIGRIVTLNPVTPKITSGFSADGKQLITMASGQILRVWDIQSGDLLRTIRTGLAEARNARGELNNHLALSPDGAYAFAYNSDSLDLAELWEISTGKAVRHYNLPPKKIDEAVVADKGTSIYLRSDEELYVLAGAKR